MIEWKIEIDTPQKVQTKLNQWRNEYIVVVHGFSTKIGDAGQDIVSVILTREKIGGKV